VRHQFFLLPIAILSLIVVVNWIGQRLPTGWPRLALIAAVAACSAASVTGWMVTWSATPGLMHQSYMDAFSAEFPGARAVYVDHFSIVPFFLHHHHWDWWLERPVGSPAQFRVWKVSSGGQEIRVCRNRAAWRLDIIDAGFYSNLGRCLQATGAPNVALFQIRPRGLPPGMGREEVYALMERLAMGAGLRSVSIAIGPSSVFGLFERAPAS
jgi:hypothetical protein